MLFLKRPGVLPLIEVPLNTDSIHDVIVDLFDRLSVLGALRRVVEPRNEDNVPGFQVNASALVWRSGDGHQLHIARRDEQRPGAQVSQSSRRS